MFVDQRRSKILDLVERMGFVSLQQLAAAVEASESTVRRDLEYLDAQGHIHRTRGGAAYSGESLTDLSVRESRASVEKQAIARHMADLISSGDTVLLDGGSTTLEVARHLTGKVLQVVTNSLPIASLMMNQERIELIFIGGYVYPKTGVALGDQAVEALRNIYVSQLVMSAGGVTSEGLFNSNALLVDTERQMIRAAEHVTLVADHTKFGQRALSHLCPLNEVNQVVSNISLGQDWQDMLRGKGITLSLADGDDQPAS
ncbi:MAG: DeoR/GlpR family DNA-binding transcription regulator [Fuerstiella sp.]|nr:DeoR/GlpR family DNA-binding transcription regulator [Fuerstiella sp.]